VEVVEMEMNNLDVNYTAVHESGHYYYSVVNLGVPMDFVSIP
jgi:hypothetical protein